ncbi:MAG: acetyl-CoA carboxylase biotin carboxyl carrier protein, partial [Treponema sp.]|nr:acetyl-CoA carboxylase biotin carboxyl carrier protein [Treponema sp.]
MNEKLILTIIDKISASSIGELELDDGTTRLVLRKERATSAEGKLFPMNEEDFASTAGEKNEDLKPLNRVRLGISAAKAEGNADGEKITSPIVATFYSSPSPDAPPFVKPGAKVKAGQTLCILEAMKMMNHLEAEFACEIIESHAVNGDLVEYG